jgi:F-type H+-transporting ATPase subunit b
MRSLVNWRVPFAASAMIMAANVALAAEEAHGEAGSGGMPQLDPSTFVSQIVWLAVAFAFLYWLMDRKLLPSITEIRTERQARIDEDLDEAARLRGEAEEAIARYEQVVAEAHDKANSAIKAAQDKLQAEYAERQSRVEAELAAKLKEAETRIERARTVALEQVHTVAVEAAQAAASKLIGIDVGNDEVERVVSEVQREVA